MANSALSSCQKELQKGEGIPSKLVIRLGTKQLTAHCESASPSASSQRESTQAVFSVHSLSGDLRNCLAYHAFTFLNQSKKKIACKFMFQCAMQKCTLGCFQKLPCVRWVCNCTANSELLYYNSLWSVY